MKKNILHLYILAVVLFAASAFTACSNNDEQASVLPVNTYTITVNATKGDDASSAPSNRALALDDTKLNATWAQGEKVTVYNVTKSTELTGNLTAQSAGASTTLTGTLTGSVAIGDELTLKFLSPNYTSQDGTLDYIAAHCDYATATVTVASISDNNITTSPANFSNQQAIVKFTLIDKADGTTKLSPTALTINYGSGSVSLTNIPASTYSDNGNGVLYVAVPGFASQDVALAATVGNDTYTCAKTGVTFDNGKYYTVSVKMALVKTLANATADDIGKVVDINGKIINSTTGAAAMIAYISNKGHGLAIALADATQTFNSGALQTTPTTVSGGTWRMPSKDDWQNMFTGCGISGDGETAYNPGNWTNKGFRDKLKACGADILTDNTYWTGTDLGNGSAYVAIFSGTQSCSFQSDDKGTPFKVRAVLEF